MLTRRVFASGLLAAATPLRPSLARFFKGGGSNVIVGLQGGGGSGTLTNKYGVWTFGSEQAVQPGYGGGWFCEPLLNGQPASPGKPIDVVPLPAFQQLWLDFGGNIYGFSFDQICNVFANYSWQGNDAIDLAHGPAPTPVPPGLPDYNPPYAPSPENTSISAGSGTLQTTDGVFSFGAVDGAGWDIQLNGVPIHVSITPGALATNLMTVYANGRLFFRTTDAVWHHWAGNQPNPSTGPTAAPVPVNISFSPTHPVVSHTVPIGSLVATISVAMSDGSAFSGSHTLDDTTYFAISGNTIVTNNAAIPATFYIQKVTTTQNGTGYERLINIGVT